MAAHFPTEVARGIIIIIIIIIINIIIWFSFKTIDLHSA